MIQLNSILDNKYINNVASGLETIKDNKSIVTNRLYFLKYKKSKERGFGGKDDFRIIYSKRIFVKSLNNEISMYTSYFVYKISDIHYFDNTLNINNFLQSYDEFLKNLFTKRNKIQLQLEHFLGSTFYEGGKNNSDISTTRNKSFIDYSDRYYYALEQLYSMSKTGDNSSGALAKFFEINSLENTNLGNEEPVIKYSYFSSGYIETSHPLHHVDEDLSVDHDSYYDDLLSEEYYKEVSINDLLNINNIDKKKIDDSLKNLIEIYIDNVKMSENEIKDLCMSDLDLNDLILFMIKEFSNDFLRVFYFKLFDSFKIYYNNINNKRCIMDLNFHSNSVNKNFISTEVDKIFKFIKYEFILMFDTMNLISIYLEKNDINFIYNCFLYYKDNIINISYKHNIIDFADDMLNYTTEKRKFDERNNI